MIKLPMVNTIQVNHSLYRLNGLNSICLKIHPIDRTKRNSVKSRISRNKLQSRISSARFNLYNTDNNRLVAHVVADLKLNTVITVCNLNAICGNLTVSESASNLNTVDVNLCGVCIKTGNISKCILILICVNQNCSISYCCGKIKNIACCGDCITLNKSGSTVKIDLIKYRILSIIYCIGVVNSKVIKIISIRTIYSSVLRPELIVLGSVSNNCKEELSLFSCLAISILLVKLIGILQCNFFKVTDVHREIVPAGFVNIIVNILGFHHADCSQGVICTVTVGISHVVTLYPTLNIILGHIEPEAYAASILQNDCITVNAQTNPSIVTGVRLLGCQAVDFKTHGIITVMYLTVGLICQRQLHIVITIIIGSAVNYVPLVNINLTILKVPKNLGSSTEIELNRSSRIFTHIESCSYSTSDISGSISLIYCNEVQSIKRTESLISGVKRYIVCTQTYLLYNTIDHSSSFYWNLYGLTERNSNNGLIK